MTLFLECSNPFGDKGKEWIEYLEVYGLVEKLRKKQTSMYGYGKNVNEVIQ